MDTVGNLTTAEEFISVKQEIDLPFEEKPVIPHLCEYENGVLTEGIEPETDLNLQNFKIEVNEEEMCVESLRQTSVIPEFVEVKCEKKDLHETSKVDVNIRNYETPRKKKTIHKCEYEDCNKVFSDKYMYNRHLRKHTGERPFKCEYNECQKTFARKDIFKRHMKIHQSNKSEEEHSEPVLPEEEVPIQTELKKFPCTVEGCNSVYSHKSSLIVHMRTHTGDKPFKCYFGGCSRAFSCSWSLIRHIKMHTGEKPYQCTFEGCGKLFGRKSHLIDHARCHSHGKRYTCFYSDCDEKFWDNADLHKHITSHTD